MQYFDKNGKKINPQAERTANQRIPCPRDTSVPGQRDAETTRLPQGRTARPIRIPNPCYAPRCAKTEVSDR